MRRPFVAWSFIAWAVIATVAAYILLHWIRGDG